MHEQSKWRHAYHRCRAEPRELIGLQLPAFSLQHHTQRQKDLDVHTNANTKYAHSLTSPRLIHTHHSYICTHARTRHTRTHTCAMENNTAYTHLELDREGVRAIAATLEDHQIGLACLEPDLRHPLPAPNTRTHTACTETKHKIAYAYARYANVPSHVRVEANASSAKPGHAGRLQLVLRRLALVAAGGALGDGNPVVPANAKAN